MKTLYNKLWTVLVLLVLSSQVCSAPFYSFDPRSLAMGGTGVASGDLTNASFHNPALLAAAQDSDDFSFTLSGGARAGDPNDLVDKFDTISTSIDSLNSLITQYESSLSVFNNSKTTDNFTTLQTDANAVIAQAKQVKEEAVATHFDKLDKDISEQIQDLGVEEKSSKQAEEPEMAEEN